MVMGKQRTFASMAWQAKGKVTRRERFLAEMDAVIPWSRLLALIGPHYPKAGQGRQPLGLEKMLRIYFLQQWFNLSDPQAEDALYDSESMRCFARWSWATRRCRTRVRFCAFAICSSSRS
jgi:transposase, IS5 family